MTRSIAALVTLTVVYLLTLASVDPLDVLVGVIVSAAVLVSTRRVTAVHTAPRGTALASRVVRFGPFALAIARDVAIGTWQVATAVLGVAPPRRPGIVAIPVGDRSPTGVKVTALAMTLSPGEVFVDFDEERGLMLFHVLDARDPEEIRRRHEDFYRRYQRGVFP